MKLSLQYIFKGGNIPPLLLSLLHLSKVLIEFGFISLVSSLSSSSIDISELVSNSSSSGAEGGVGGGEGRLENPSLNSFSRSIATIRSNPSSRAISRDVLPSLQFKDNWCLFVHLLFYFSLLFFSHQRIQKSQTVWLLCYCVWSENNPVFFCVLTCEYKPLMFLTFTIWSM